jgi:hypothetical protein
MDRHTITGVICVNPFAAMSHDPDELVPQNRWNSYASDLPAVQNA